MRLSANNFILLSIIIIRFNSTLFMKKFAVFAVMVLAAFNTQAQKNKPGKYPSLMWEITGNGLSKPSYLFGTMHVSSKMVFHLSDSFYHAIKSCDAVSLELNPETWQPEMFRMEQSQRDLRSYMVNGGADYLEEKSFRLEEYDDKLKRALNEEPTQVNGLLYRTYQSEADFEENTYLDLYIYQTGRKLGKKAAGVENFLETEKIVVEAYQDMAKEKNKKRADTDGESYYTIQKKIQEAYRRGDLDLLDSLERITSTSAAFDEKFLYKRNEIQANSIDSILKQQTLFVGVGAAHLPGSRGVIELLRKKGYKLRPVKMADRDAEQKEKIDKMKVPVVMQPHTTEDGFIKLMLPGQLYRRSESRANASWQYADMENGTYYMISRVATHASLLGQTENDVIKKVDSLLYENIPGKILKKTTITRNGYSGYDITNKTRRGDIQRYNILVTPYEVLVFKMSGNDDYVSGKEADDFFNSIEVGETKPEWTTYQPATGGFSASFPRKPNVIFNSRTSDDNDTWEYEAVDKTNNDGYLILKKNVHNYRFIEEDTFDLSLIEESLLRSEMIDKQTSRKFGKVNGYPSLDMQFSLKNGGGVLKAKALIKGPHYYLLIARGKKSNSNFDKFLNSFAVTDFKYAAPALYTDTIYKFSVESSVHPTIDKDIRDMTEQMASEENTYSNDQLYSYWPRDRYAYFKNDTTGESILVSIQTFAKYYYSKDSAKFWKDQIKWDNLKQDFIIQQKDFIKVGDSAAGYKYVLLDTNSSRKITGMLLLKDNKLFRVLNLSDNIGKESEFVSRFFSTFRPDDKHYGPSVFTNKLDQFFEDFYSKDSLTKKRASGVVSNLYYGPGGIDKIKSAINKMRLGDKDYFDLKSRFISELGYIDDSCCINKVVGLLKDIYEQTADTSSFQNAVILSLARLRTKESTTLLKELLLQDPPVFSGDYAYSDVFDMLSDSLPLASQLFPELLQLASLDDYKQPVNDLLRTLVDSGYIKAADYDSYYSKLYFDAKIELKKQQNRDEKVVEKESVKEDEESDDNNRYYNGKYDYDGNSGSIDDYAALLMPFYEKHPPVQKFFDKLLQSKDKDVQLNTLQLMIRNKHSVPDSVFTKLAESDQYRAKLLSVLEDLDRKDLFPAKYKNQQDIAKSLLLNDQGYEKFYGIEMLGKRYVETKDEKGYVYFFKYKAKKDGDWQIGLSGIQPVDQKEVSSNDDLVKMTEKKLKDDEPVIDQFEKKLKQLLFAQHKSAVNFFNDRDNRYANYLEDRFINKQ